jgi:hypothetical protein
MGDSEQSCGLEKTLWTGTGSFVDNPTLALSEKTYPQFEGMPYTTCPASFSTA